MDKYIIDSSPHLRGNITVNKIMVDVIIALMPALFVGCMVFGTSALVIVLTSIITAVLSEYIFIKIFNKDKVINITSSVLTGLLFAFILPPKLPLFIVIIGASFAVVLGKCIYGGLGHNIFNPALMGRAFLLASWPVHMTTWQPHFFYKKVVDAASYATPLELVKLSEYTGSPGYKELFLGLRGGCIGEISVAALLLGAVYLLFKRVIKLYIPLSYILTVFVISFVLGRDPVFNMLAGGLIIGAFFMATDYVTSPLMPRAQIIFGIGCGIFTCLIRFYGGYPEGVCYSILFMNLFTPLLNKYMKR